MRLSFGDMHWTFDQALVAVVGGCFNLGKEPGSSRHKEMRTWLDNFLGGRGTAPTPLKADLTSSAKSFVELSRKLVGTRFNAQTKKMPIIWFWIASSSPDGVVHVKCRHAFANYLERKLSSGLAPAVYCGTARPPKHTPLSQDALDDPQAGTDALVCTLPFWKPSRAAVRHLASACEFSLSLSPKRDRWRSRGVFEVLLKAIERLQRKKPALIDKNEASDHPPFVSRGMKKADLLQVLRENALLPDGYDAADATLEKELSYVVRFSPGPRRLHEAGATKRRRRVPSRKSARG